MHFIRSLTSHVHREARVSRLIAPPPRLPLRSHVSARTVRRETPRETETVIPHVSKHCPGRPDHGARAEGRVRGAAIANHFR